MRSRPARPARPVRLVGDEGREHKTGEPVVLYEGGRGGEGAGDQQAYGENFFDCHSVSSLVPTVTDG
jgi:hypothetical protein